MRPLPEEICHMVAGSLVRECAAVHLQESSLAAEARKFLARHFSYEVNLSHDIYAQYVYLEGVRYIRALFNERPANPGTGQRIYDAQPKRAIQTVYMSDMTTSVSGTSFLPSRTREMAPAGHGGQNSRERRGSDKSPQTLM